MKVWDKRPIEIRNLLNPAFCGLILCRAMAGYEEKSAEGLPFSLSVLVLPLCLHKYSREVINRGSKGYLLKTIENNPELLVGFPERAHDLLPFTFEGLGFAMHFGSFEVTNQGCLKIFAKQVKKTVSGTDESKMIQRTARYIGKEFAEIYDRSTIYKSLGIRP